MDTSEKSINDLAEMKQIRLGPERYVLYVPGNGTVRRGVRAPM